MTTTVTVKTHDWPASVQQFPLCNRQPVEGAEYIEIAVVEPHSSYDFHPHSGADILIRELPSPEERGEVAEAATE